MCYSGKCKYEDCYGDCQIRDGKYPDDAGCVLIEKEISLKEENENDSDTTPFGYDGDCG
jgi:hypothetical protein